METLPEYLKAAREALSYDLRHVARVTNISEKFLESLENGYYHRLPADVYVFGFLRKLSELYSVESDILVHQFKKERGVHENLAKAKVYQSYKPPKFSLTPKTMIFGTLIVFVLFVLGYLFYQVYAINKPPFLEVFEPRDGARITSSSFVVQGKTEIGSTVTMNEQRIFVDSDGNFRQPVSLSPGEKVLTFVARNNFGKESTKALVIYGDFQIQETTYVQNKEEITLVVTVGPNSTWISIQTDNSSVQDETFIAGSSKTYTAKEKFILSTGDAGSTSVKLNGKELGKLGRDGEIIRDIPFTEDSVNTR